MLLPVWFHIAIQITCVMSEVTDSMLAANIILGVGVDVLLLDLQS